MSTNGQCPRQSLDSLRKKIESYSYSANDILGSGYSSEVFKGYDVRTGKSVAIKVINLHKIREKGLEDLLMRQIKLLQELKHENVVYCLDALMTSNNCYIVTDHCTEGDLCSFLAKKGKIKIIQEEWALMKDLNLLDKSQQLFVIFMKRELFTGISNLKIYFCIMVNLNLLISALQ